jgi:hypothetical protein
MLCLTYIDCKKGRKGTKKKERTKNTLNKEKIEKTRIKNTQYFLHCSKAAVLFYLFIFKF